MKKLDDCVALGSIAHDPNNIGGCRDCKVQGVQPFTLSRPQDVPHLEEHPESFDNGTLACSRCGLPESDAIHWDRAFDAMHFYGRNNQ